MAFIKFGSVQHQEIVAKYLNKCNIDDLHQDLNSIYSDYDRGKIDKKLVTETAFNICQAFVRDNQPKGIKECPTCQGDGAIYERRNLATRDK